MESEIRERTAALVTALERGDAAGAVDVYADGARLLVSAPEPIEGRSEIEAYWQAGVELGLCGLTFETRVLEWLDGGALELGRYAVTVHDTSAPPAVEHGSYLVLHTQTDDGSWRRAVEVFNPDEPTTARRNLGKEEQ